jgi:DNA-binding beta-propeller fold protein YncE
VRAPAQPAFTFSGRSIGPEKSEFKDVSGLAFNNTGQLLLGHKGGVVLFKGDGSIAQSVAAVDATAFLVDEQERIVVARQGSLIAARADAIVFSAPGGDNQMRAIDEISAVLPTARGERLIANPKGKNVIRAMPNGKFVSVFATGQIVRMAQNWMGDVAMLDKASKSVAIADRDGKALSRIPAKGTGYELDEPTDLAYDALGHLYVLDRARSSVYVFGPKNRLVATLAVPDKSPGSLSRGEALAVDAAGRLYVFDDRSRRIQVYQ